ncbi:MAG: condensation domain-containing protein, partial [Clostridia bacterium]|nr:condensation domain-containing protein [Clostridia bacterium]
LPDIKIKSKECIQKANTETEKVLENILKKMLNVKEVDFSENLLALGGDSLTAISLNVQISKEIGTDISIKELMETKNFAELCNVIDNKQKLNKISLIKKIEDNEYYITSSAQKRIYMASQMSNNVVYNMPGKIQIKGNLDVSKLENAFKELISRHESLRTYFEMLRNGEIVQKIKTNNEFKLPIIKCDEINIESKIKNFVKPFKLSEAPLLRVQLLQLKKNKFILLFDMHHIISDGTSIQILMKELEDIYNGNKLKNIKITYKDYTYWEDENIEQGNLKKQEEFWLNQFSDEVPLLSMPLDFKRPEVKSFKGDTISTSVDREMSKNIIKLANKYNTTPYIILLSAYYILLSKYTNQSDIVIASPIINRQKEELNSVIGMFVNNIPIRIKTDDRLIFDDLVSNVKNLSLKCFDNQSYPFDKIVQKLNLNSNNQVNSLFNTMFVYQNNENLTISLNELETKIDIIDINISKFDLTLQIKPQKESFDIYIEYSTDLFRRETIQYLKEHYINVLKEITTNPKIILKDIDIMTNEEKNKILYQFNNTKINYENKTIQELFEEHVERKPNATALIFEDEKIKYDDLNKKTNSLAAYLREEGVTRNSIVGLSMKRSPELIVGLLAILKAGGAYLPIDPLLPQDRKEYMIESSGCKLLLVDNNKNTYKDIKTINIKGKNILSNSTRNIPNINSESDLFGVLFTSGSTGKPKCAALTRKRT